MTSATAPAKIILFGEHAVVYGYPALAIPVNQVNARAVVTRRRTSGVRVEAPDIDLSADLAELPPDQPLGAVIRSVLNELKIGTAPNLTIHVTSSIPVASGLGSGAAVSVAIIRCLSNYLGNHLSNEQVSGLAFEAEKMHHGTPSGIDNAVVTYGKPIYFVKGRPIQTLGVGVALTLVIADTGIRAPTKESVAAVRRLWEGNPPRWDQVFERVGRISAEARKAMEAGEIRSLGSLMDANHTLLQEMTVSCPELDKLVDAAHKSGALGAKLSGGGRGGTMIALVQKKNAPALAEALVSAGAKRTIVTRIKAGS